jgi:hypothetical protein
MPTLESPALLFPFTPTKVALFGKVFGGLTGKVRDIAAHSAGEATNAFHGVPGPIASTPYVHPTHPEVLEASDAIRHPLQRGAAVLGRHKLMAGLAGGTLGALTQVNDGNGSPLTGFVAGATLGGIGAHAARLAGNSGHDPKAGLAAAKMRNLVEAKAKLHQSGTGTVEQHAALDKAINDTHQEMALYTRSNEGAMERAQRHARIPEDMIDAGQANLKTFNPAGVAPPAGAPTPA